MMPLLPVITAARSPVVTMWMSDFSCKLVLLGVVVGALGRTACLLRLEVHHVVGLGDAGLLVEGQRVGHQVQRILQLGGRSLVRLARPFGVTLQVDVHFADAP